MFAMVGFVESETKWPAFIMLLYYHGNLLLRPFLTKLIYRRFKIPKHSPGIADRIWQQGKQQEIRSYISNTLTYQLQTWYIYLVPPPSVAQ